MDNKLTIPINYTACCEAMLYRIITEHFNSVFKKCFCEYKNEVTPENNSDMLELSEKLHDMFSKKVE